MKQVIAGIGEVLWDCLPEGRKLGGAPANFAFHVGQFGFDTVAVSALGKDALGDEASRALAAKHLRCIMPRVDCPTGTVEVSLDAEGVPVYDIREGVAWDNIPFTPDMEAAAAACRAVCFGSLAQRSAVSRTTIHRFLAATPAGCLKIFDINLRQHFYTKEILSESIRLCDVLKINDEELSVVSRLFGLPAMGAEEACRRLIDEYGLRMVVLTCGATGSCVFAPGVKSCLATPAVDVADTVGAGDSFTASFTAALLAGKTIAEAHRLAVDVSAYVCTQHGAMPQLPDSLVGRIG